MPITLNWNPFLYFSTADRSGGFRMVGVMPLAALLTGALFLLMRTMIAFQTPETTKAPVHPHIMISPEVKELKPQHMAHPEPVEHVELPPPPTIEKTRAQKPTEGGHMLGGSIPVIAPVAVHNVPTNLNIDRETTPIVRVAPIYPPQANGRAGSCEVFFSVNAKGQPFDIETQCSSSVFMRAVQVAVSQWKYAPKMMDGQAVVRTGLHTTITFQTE